MTVRYRNPRTGEIAQWSGGRWEIVGGASQAPAGLLERMVQVESGGNPRAVSRSGAMGLLQLMPGTARELGVTDPFDPAQNLAAGRRYLEQMARRYGDWRLAAMAYHAGPGNVDKWLRGQRSGVGPRTLAYPEKLGLGSVRGLLAG